MGSILQEILLVQSLRKNIRDPKVPSAIQKSIETIHHCIHSETYQQGWKPVEWRGSHSGRATNGASRPRTANRDHPPNQNHQSNHQPFANRQRNHVVQDTSNTSNTSNTNHTSNQPAFQKPAWHDHSDGFRTPHQKYVSKFKKSSEKVEDTILNTILLGKLNKFSAPNYPEIKEFITHIIDSGQTDMIKCFMKLVFEKAASEEVFCPLYARLLSELSLQYPVLLTEMANLYSQYMEIFEEVSELGTETYNELCKRNVEKKYRRGYSQFLAELIKHNVIDQDTFMKIITKIIRQIELNLSNKESIKLNEEFADCFMKIMKAIRVETVDTDEPTDEPIQNIRFILKNELSNRIKPLSVSTPEFVGLSNKARFTFLDIYESIQQF